jgi:hypothetical protein
MKNDLTEDPEMEYNGDMNETSGYNNHKLNELNGYEDSE